MIKHNIMKPLLFAIPLVFFVGSNTQTSVAQPGLCNNFPGFKVTIDVQKLAGGEITTSVKPYTLVVPDPAFPGQRTGDQRHILICLTGNAEFSGQKVVWEARGPSAPPFGEFGVARAAGNARAGTNFIFLTNTNLTQGIFNYVALVKVNGTNIELEIDPRVDNSGGGH